MSVGSTGVLAGRYVSKSDCSINSTDQGGIDDSYQRSSESLPRRSRKNHERASDGELIRRRRAWRISPQSLQPILPKWLWRAPKSRTAALISQALVADSFWQYCRRHLMNAKMSQSIVIDTMKDLARNNVAV
jgi:hypothetical protein